MNFGWPARFIEHEAETGGGPTGFGWASFLVLLVGVGAIAYSLGTYLVARAAMRKNTSEGTSRVERGSTEHDFDPYDDLTRN